MAAELSGVIRALERRKAAVPQARALGYLIIEAGDRVLRYAS